MNPKRILIWALFCVFIVTCNLPCKGQSSNSYKQKGWNIISSRGSAGSSSYSLNESVMGGVVVGTSASNSYSLNGSMLFTSVRDSSLVSSLLPKIFQLLQNYPNPFNPKTTISYSLPKKTDVTIQIINTIGQVVKTYDLGNKPLGNHKLAWDGKDEYGKQVVSGVYLYRILADDFTSVRKMLLLK